MAQAAAQATVTITPLEEKVAVLEKEVEVPRESQYALKFVGAAISSTWTQSKDRGVTFT